MSRPLTPLAAGGTGDTLARDVAQAMEPLLGVPITVENRAGANGIPGTGCAGRQARRARWSTDSMRRPTRRS